jgi:hypothetical protein
MHAGSAAISFTSWPTRAGLLDMPMGGGPRNSIELRFGTGVHPSEPTSRNSIEKAHRGWGEGQKSDATIVPDRRLSHSRIFFRRAGFSAGRARASAAILSIYQWPLSVRWARRAYLFSIACEPPGGRSKIWGLFIPDRWAATHIFPRISGNFFLEPGTVIRARKNCREIQGGGVAHG